MHAPMQPHILRRLTESRRLSGRVSLKRRKVTPYAHLFPEALWSGIEEMHPKRRLTQKKRRREGKRKRKGPRDRFARFGSTQRQNNTSEGRGAREAAAHCACKARKRIFSLGCAFSLLYFVEAFLSLFLCFLDSLPSGSCLFLDAALPALTSLSLLSSRVFTAFVIKTPRAQPRSRDSQATLNFLFLFSSSLFSLRHLL
ncbi:hypothetical protein TGME49_227995 [Toxoplasma gondii ME49]|uniref:Transmembrane protein n=3 Tax=Toxoplasma gondii TaxID=5811 RepID=S8EUY8_TOXGM|nr:hypothetical protein TGME49_227995 [Toxoplasma gondii ME49]EPT27271.1 hypothetical protein TGME49_227995 [Toxoplasma gondii ME49]PIM02989.1 putative transmembrane protein [Toxoplasma gondii COUG]|eukprot:XP_018636084.1 hypothetical protein TGME49_227995 [Toxoplasma gondii ME49]